MGICGSSSIEFKTNIKDYVEALPDEWDLGRKIGQGSFGKVYLGRHKKSKQIVAIKVCPMTNEVGNNVSSEEAEVWQTLHHPNIVKLFFAVEEADELILITEYMRGGELFDKIVAQGEIEGEEHYSERWARGIALDILRGLAYLHENEIVHRDMKPENLLLDKPGKHFTVKIADFGYASKLRRKAFRKHLGTPGYCAPEIYLSRPYRFECDMWSFGCILYILLTGSPPFDHEDDAKAAQETVAGEYDLTLPEFADMSPHAIDLIKRLLCVDQRERITAKQALRHKWMTVMSRSLSSKRLAGSQKNLKSYIAKRRWKTATGAVRASLRLSKKLRSSVKDRLQSELSAHKDLRAIASDLDALDERTSDQGRPSAPTKTTSVHLEEKTIDVKSLNPEVLAFNLVTQKTY